MKLLSALVLLAAASSGVQAVNSADALRALIRGREAARLTPQGVNGPSSAASLTVSPAPLLTPVYDLGADGCVHPACPSAGGAAPSTVSPALGSAAVEADDITIRSAEESSSEASGAATGSLQAVINSYTADIKQNLAKLQGESTGPSAAAVQAVAAESSALAAKVAQAVAAAKSEESSEASAALAKAASEASGLASEASQAAAKAEASAAAAAAESAAVLSRLTAVEGQVAQLRARVDAIPARAEESSAAPAPAPVAPAPRSEESSGLLPSRSEELSSPQVSVSEVSRAAADQLRDELKAEVRREVRAEVKAEAAQLVQKTTEVILMEAGTPPQQAKEKARKAVEEAQALIDARQQEESSREVVAESSESSQSPEQKLATLVAKKVEDELAGKVAQIASAVAKHEAESVVSEGSESSRQRSQESSSRSEESSEESSESAAAILAKAARFAETRERAAVKTASTKVLAAALGIERPALGAKSLTDLDIDKLVEGNGVTHRELDATLRAARNNARFQELGLGANAGDDLDVPLDESL